MQHIRLFMHVFRRLKLEILSWVFQMEMPHTGKGIQKWQVSQVLTNTVEWTLAPNAQNRNVARHLASRESSAHQNESADVICSTNFICNASSAVPQVQPACRHFQVTNLLPRSKRSQSSHDDMFVVPNPRKGLYRTPNSLTHCLASLCTSSSLSCSAASEKNSMRMKVCPIESFDFHKSHHSLLFG